MASLQVLIYTFSFIIFLLFTFYGRKHILVFKKFKEIQEMAILVIFAIVTTISVSSAAYGCNFFLCSHCVNFNNNPSSSLSWFF